MPTPTINPAHRTQHTARPAVHPPTPGPARLRAVPVPGAAPDRTPGASAGPRPHAAGDPVDDALGLLALAVDVCADEVAHLLSRPTPRARRPGPVVRFYGPPAA
jgi:hypothetical protein